MAKATAADIRQSKIENFNPDENGLAHHGIFGLPFEEEESQIVLLPVPWEVTVSYSAGTAKGPEAILDASQQLDLYDPIYPGGWRMGIAMLPVSKKWQASNADWRQLAAEYIQSYGKENTDDTKVLSKINSFSKKLNAWVESQSNELLNEGKITGIVGGEHSVPYGLMKALAEKHPGYGILQIDAHADLRPAYEGFEHSHASIMYNAEKIAGISSIVQVGIRDYSEGENAMAQSAEKISLFTDYSIRKALMSGVSWDQIADNIIKKLPREVYISFDIDGLQPWLCPHTGTPVPGGFTLDEVFYLLEKVVESGRRIIGFDLVEVAPGEDEWDGNVGARVLYKLCLLAGKSNQLV
jgi:agmatinase